MPIMKQGEKQQSKNDDAATPLAKAERLKRVRNLANLSREDFCTDNIINLTTLISWEIGRFGGLSKKGAASVSARVAREGVFVTPEWLLYEIGTGPHVDVDFKKSLNANKEITSQYLTETNDVRIILEELFFFRKRHLNAISHVINDDSMLPHYREGDYVAGTQRFDSNIKTLLGFDCIVKTKDSQIFMLNLQSGTSYNSYNLIPTNLYNGKKVKIIVDVELISAAPVIWHRRREPIL